MHLGPAALEPARLLATPFRGNLPRVGYVRGVLFGGIALTCLTCCTRGESPCEQFARLSEHCSQGQERRAVSLSICENAYAREGEHSEHDPEHARYVAWLNATLRLQAECAARAADCTAFATCTELRAPR